MKIVEITLFAILLFSFEVHSQNFRITGKIIDESNQPLPGAHIALRYPWGEEVKAVVSEPNGRFFFNQVENGGYQVVISYLGYLEKVQEVTLANSNIDMGDLALTPDATQLTEVEVRDKIPIATQSGDTTSFNADAFKVMKDASTEELLEKMPSVVIQDGKVQAQGEDVKQVLVDGRPFFGNDPSAALKNLPAEVVQKIQIYDQQSDQSQFTGFDDGNTSKTINIITRPDMRAGQFGKVYGGYGYEDKYQTGGNINFFNGDQRISLIGMSNNINIQNFAVDDLLGVVGSSGRRGRGGRGGSRRGGSGRGGGSVNDFLVVPQGGIATTHAFGINYSDKWSDQLEVTASYFFNQGDSNSEEFTTQQFIDADGFGEIYDEVVSANSINTNHRLNGRIEWEIDSMNSFIFQPGLSLQMNDGNSLTFGKTTLEDQLLSQSDNYFLSDLTGVNFSNNLLWRHKMAKKGRTFSINISNGYAPKKGDNQLYSRNAYFVQPASFDTLDQQSNLDINSWNIASNLNYTEPVGEKGQIMLEYRISYQQEDSDRKTFDFEEATNDYTGLNNLLSNVFSNDYTTHRGGVGYNYRPSRDLMFMARASYQYARLNNDQAFPLMMETNQQFKNMLPFAMLRYNINGREKNLRVFYYARTELPAIEQLQNVVDNSNPLQLSTGNPALKQSYSNNLFMRYQATNVERSTVFYAMIRGTITSDYIANATWFAASDHPVFEELDAQPGTQLTQPVNLDGYRSLRTFITYGMPVKRLKSNFNIDLNWNYSRTPGLIDGERNHAGNHTFGTGLTLSSNISDQVDFTLAARPSFSRVRNSLQSSGDNDFITQDSRVKLNWIVVEGFIFRSELSHQLYSGLSESFNQNYWLWNVGIGKKLFKNERGEITLSVNDMLNQNRNINRTVTETYIQDTQTNALTRFVMLSFTYNLRHFDTGKQKSKGEDEERRPPWMR